MNKKVFEDALVIEALRVCGHNPEYNDPQYIDIPDNEAKKLRYWQPDCFESVKNERYSMISAFCGSGKSLLQDVLAIHDIVESDFTQKQLIVVPQNHIHGGFSGDKGLDYIPLIVGGEKYEWTFGKNNFCEDSQQVLTKLKRWLLTGYSPLSKRCKNGVITGLNAIVTQQALCLVWQVMTHEERIKAIHRLTSRIDEFHHVKSVFCDDDTEYSEEELAAMEVESTIIGDICRFIVKYGDENSKICGTTATYYRGDRCPILSKAVSEKFTFYHLNWLDHFKTLGIKDFSLTYEEYKTDPIDMVIAKILIEPDEKHMIVVPSSTHKWRVDGKREMDDLFKKLYEVIPKERVLDLVTKSTQAKNKALLLKEPKTPEDGESKYDVVVTCMLGREGMDWCPCSRLYNTATENSITLAIQTFGRPFRRFLGKDNLKFFFYVPEFQKPKKGMSKTELLGDRTNALLVCVQIDEFNNPILFPVIPSPKSKNKGRKKKEPVSLVDVFQDQYETVKYQLLIEIESLEKKTAENIDAVIKDLMLEYDVHKNVQDSVRDGLRALTLRVLSPALKAFGVDIKFLREAGFNNLVEKHNIKDKTIFFEGGYSVKDMALVKEILSCKWDEWAEAYAKEFAGGE